MGDGETLGERGADEQRPQQTRSAGEGDGTQFGLVDTGPFDGFGDNRHNVLLMGPRSQFGHYASVCFMDGLTGYHVGKHHPIADDSCRRIVA